MKMIYLDADFRCHLTNDGTMTAIETDAFDGKCQAYIEGYRFVPHGCTWMREDGVEFRGEMSAPWRPYEELVAAQAACEHEDLERLREAEAAMEAAYTEGVGSA